MMLLDALRDTGGGLRLHLAPAGLVEARMLEDVVSRAEGWSDVAALERIGTPVRMRALVGMPGDQRLHQPPRPDPASLRRYRHSSIQPATAKRSLGSAL